jgi:hypothetical protein
MHRRTGADLEGEDQCIRKSLNCVVSSLSENNEVDMWWAIEDSLRLGASRLAQDRLLILVAIIKIANRTCGPLANFVVGNRGFEPLTSSMSTRRSNQLS